MNRRLLRGLTSSTTVVIVAVMALVAVGAYLLRGGGGEADQGADVFVVQRGDFDISIPASGELAALRQIEIASRLDDRATITYIVEEGKVVKEGDTLLRFNDEAILDGIKDAEDAVNTAETAWVTAESNLRIKRKSNASELTRADLEVRLAELALRAWEEGEAVSKRRSLELEVETAQKDHDRLVARFEASKKLLEQEFISQDEFKRDEIEMIRARSRLEQARLARKVYETYEHEQDRARLESDLDQAKDRRSEIAQRSETEIQSLETDVNSKAYQLESRRERLDKFQRQLELCTVRAPQDGLVVYTASLHTGRHGQRDQDVPQVGTDLRRNQPVIALPDTSEMIAEVKVNEALSGRISVGQRAIVMSDALPDMPLTGEIIAVGVLAETGGWRDPNRRDYTVQIELQGEEGLGLKPSMRCRADIYVGQVNDALFVPAQAVFRTGPAAYVYVPDGAGWAQRRVEVGRSSEMHLEIISGLGEGDAVLVREPDAARITSEIEVSQGPPSPDLAPDDPTQARR